MDINPDKSVVCIRDFVDRSNVVSIIGSDFDLVFDCVDNAPDKASIITHCTLNNIPCITSGAAAGGIDPTTIVVDDLARADGGDRLLAGVRRQLRKDGVFEKGPGPGIPNKHRPVKWGVKAVFSRDQPEVIKDNDAISRPVGSSSLRFCDNFSAGTADFVVGTFGFIMVKVGLDLLVEGVSSSSSDGGKRTIEADDDGKRSMIDDDKRSTMLLGKEYPSDITGDGPPSSSNLSSKKGILFDIDGTLSNSWRLGYEASKEVLLNHPGRLWELTEEEYHDHTRYCTPERLARHVGLTPSTDPKSSFIIEGNRLGKLFDDMYIARVSTKTAGFYPEISSLISELSALSIPLGALTNAARDYATAVFICNGCSESFASVHGADSVPCPKPSADGLLLCAEEMELDPRKCVYVGDSPSDGEAARAAGMRSIGVTWGSHEEGKIRRKFDVLCRDVGELKEKLLGFVGDE